MLETNSAQPFGLRAVRTQSLFTISMDVKLGASRQAKPGTTSVFYWDGKSQGAVERVHDYAGDLEVDDVFRNATGRGGKRCVGPIGFHKGNGLKNRRVPGEWILPCPRIEVNSQNLVGAGGSHAGDRIPERKGAGDEVEWRHWR